MQFHWSETSVSSIADTTAYRPNCVWITGFDGSDNGITSQGFSMPIIDFSRITQQRANNYRANLDLMCNSPPRFSIWNTIYDGVKPPFFIPALEYNTIDGSDIDIQKVVNNLGVDKTDYDQNVRVDKDNKPIHPVRQPFFTPSSKKKKRIIPSWKSFHERNATGLHLGLANASHPDGRHRSSRVNAGSALNRDMFLGSLIYSSHSGHSAKELCDAPNSYGPDVVSWKEGFYCGMNHKELCPLCTKELLRNCFDTEDHDIRMSIGKRGRRGGKGYNSIKNWGEK